MTQLTAPQQQVVDAINQLNEEQGVASALYVSALTGLTLTYTNQLCQSLKELGVVTWTPNVPSLKVTPLVAPDETEADADHDADGEEADEQERKRRIRNEALARGRATAAANRAAKAHSPD